MLARLSVCVAFCKTEIDYEAQFFLCAYPHHEVVRLNVPVQEINFMQTFYSLQQLNCEHQCCLETKFLFALLEAGL
jgi:hypothetical protein